MLARAGLCAPGLSPQQRSHQRSSLVGLRKGCKAWGIGKRLHLPGSLRKLAGRQLLLGSPRRGRPSRGSGSGRAAPVRAVYGWPVDGPLKAILEIRAKLKPVAVALRILWDAQQRWLQHALARAAVWAGLLAGLATIAANVWGVPAINRRLLPMATQQAAVVLQREVELGRVRWVAPTGLTGMMPLASVGPVSLGPGPVERSSLKADEVLVGIDALRSAMQHELVLTVRAKGAEVNLVQADNFSWFGYPDDTTPSARNFVPGLGGSGTAAGPGQGGGGASAASNGGGSGGAGSGGGSGSEGPGGGGGAAASSEQGAGSGAADAGSGSDADVGSGTSGSDSDSGGSSSSAELAQACAGSAAARSAAPQSQRAVGPAAAANPAHAAGADAGPSFLDRIAQLLAHHAEELGREAQREGDQLVLQGLSRGGGRVRPLAAAILPPGYDLAMSRDNPRSSGAAAAPAGSSAPAAAATASSSGGSAAAYSSEVAAVEDSSSGAHAAVSSQAAPSASSSSGSGGAAPRPSSNVGRQPPAAGRAPGMPGRAPQAGPQRPSEPASSSDDAPAAAAAPASVPAGKGLGARQAVGTTQGASQQPQPAAAAPTPQAAAAVRGGGGGSSTAPPSAPGPSSQPSAADSAAEEAPNSQQQSQQAAAQGQGSAVQEEGEAALAAVELLAAPRKQRRHQRGMRVHKGLERSVPVVTAAAPSATTAPSAAKAASAPSVAPAAQSQQQQQQQQQQAGATAAAPAQQGQQAQGQGQQVEGPAPSAAAVGGHFELELGGIDTASSGGEEQQQPQAEAQPQPQPQPEEQPTLSPAELLRQRVRPVGSQSAPGPGTRLYSAPAGSWADASAAASLGQGQAGSRRALGLGMSISSKQQGAAATSAAGARHAAKPRPALTGTAGAAEQGGPPAQLSKAAQAIRSIPPIRFSLPCKPPGAPPGRTLAGALGSAPAGAQGLLSFGHPSAGSAAAAQPSTAADAAAREQGQVSAEAAEALRAWQVLPPEQRQALVQQLGSLPSVHVQSLVTAEQVVQRQEFAARVTDPSTLRKRAGAAGIRWRHRRPQAAPQAASSAAAAARPQPRAAGAAAAAPGPASAKGEAAAAAQGRLFEMDESSTTPSLVGRAPASALSDAETAAADAAAAAALEAPGMESAADAAPAGGAAMGSEQGAGRRLGMGPRVSRPRLMHPGYFTKPSGPKYTPAGPEALAERRAKHRVPEAVRSALHAALSKLEVPSVAVGQVAVEGGTLVAHITGEEVPRVMVNVNAEVQLGRDYDTVDAKLSASPHERNPASRKFTMPSPHASRHLRHVTGLAAQQAQQAAAAAAQQAAVPVPEAAVAEHGQPAAGAASAAPSAPAAAATGTPPSGSSNSSSSSSSTSSSSIPSSKPAGGGLQVELKLSGLSKGFRQSEGIVPDMTVVIRGQQLHAPLVERTVELPMDIHEGRITGELVVKSHDPASWKFPEFHGRLAVRGGEFHFWDSPDDISADMDLLFERDRLYLHNAAGRFGAVPMTLTGDLDLDPDTGAYRLSATVPGVEVNSLRASLGVRPMPMPVAGAVSGTLHITGPLEKPVFSGTVQVVRPTPEQLADCEPTQALDTLLSEPAAAGAYDKLPVQSAGAVFTLDTSREALVLHSMHAEPVGGGQLFGSGRMVVAPWAEMFPGAVSIKAEGVDLPVEALAQRYLPADTKLPPSLVLGKANLTATMKGSHLSPTIDVSFQLPDAPATGSAQFTREATRFTLASPTADANGTLFLRPPSYEAVKAAITQTQALALAVPNPTGCDADVVLRGVDVVPLTSDEQALRQLQQSGQPLRLRVNGRAKISGKVASHAAHAPAAAGNGVAAGSPAAAMAGRSAGGNGAAGAAGAAGGPGSGGWAFDGSLGLEGVRLNQLQLFKKLAGTLQASEQRITIRARGDRADEVLNLDLALPLLLPASAPEPVAPRLLPAPPAASAAAAAAGSDLQAAGAEAGANSSSEPAAAAPVPAVLPPAPPAGGGSRLLLRGGQLMAAANVDARGSQLDFKVQNLRLDELELASLRGDVQEVSCALNFLSQTGRGKAHLVRPRYSGLMGESLSGGFRWERDVVRLERVVVQQDKSKYEVQGEYAIPPNTRLPATAAELAAQQQQGAVPSGRWRLQVTVPGAELQEIIPAARLLQTATSLTPAEYERAKQAFLRAVEDTKIQAQDLKSQLLTCVEAQLEPAGAAAPAAPAAGAARAAGGGGAAAAPARASPPRVPAGGAGNAPLPGLQDLRGQWSGGFQAYGGGAGPTSLEFDVRGAAWQWGPHYGLDSLATSGSFHSEEGLQLQEFVLKSGDAKLMVRGSLLGDSQDASIVLNDFPMATLRPLFRAIPALQHAAPAVSTQPAKPGSSPRPLGMVSSMMGRASNGLGLPGAGGAAAGDSPINGVLYLSGKLGGSKDAPTGEVAVRLYDAAIGSTRLAQAQGSARLNDQLQLTFHVDVSPADGHRTSGHLRAEGRIPLAPTQQQQQQQPAAAAAAAAAPAGSAGGSAAGAAADAAAAASAAAAPAPGPVVRRDQPLDVRVVVRDGGMSILTSVTPDLRWQHGAADISFRVTGTLDAPSVSGHASFGKATLDCPILRFPLTNLGGEVRVKEGMLYVDGLEARAGRKGHIRVRGSLPIGTSAPAAPAVGPAIGRKLMADVQGLELRVKNMYTGQYDASLTVRSSLAQPSIAGSMRFSRGTLFLLPQAAGAEGAAPGGGAAAAARSAASASGASRAAAAPQAQAQPRAQRWGDGPVARAFEAFSRKEPDLAEQINAMMQQEVEELEQLAEEAQQHQISLDKLSIALGPDLRATVPLVMNFSVTGGLEVSGPAHPDKAQVRGRLKLPSGDVNLVATQLALDREHANSITFAPAADGAPGVDPLIDLVLTGGDLRLTIQGKASEWQDHLVLQYVGGRQGGAAGEGQGLDTAEAARILEDKLKAALLADNGQLALARLAGTTVSTLMPKIETQGQLGTTRFRLVSAPSIPGLLSLDPSLSDPSSLLNSIMMGTQGEIQFGPRLQAVMVRKMGESDVATQWTLNYNLSSRLRMQFSVTSAPPYPKTLMFQFNSDGTS